MSITVSPDDAKVGSSFDLILDTLFVGIAGLTTWRIYFRKPGAAAAFKTATVVESTKLLAAFEPTDTDIEMNMYTWTYARGTGTIVFKGKTFMIPIVAEDR